MKLFEPLPIGRLVLPNRVTVPAMVTRLAGEDGVVNDAIVERYRRFAEGGAGLIVVEATSVHGGKSGPLLRASSDEFIPGLARLAAAVHAGGPGRVFLQIIHFFKVARSGWRQKLEDVAAAELDKLPAMFAAAALRARQAGFDGVELHMAHAYTLSSCLSRRNRRPDRYGGSLENRLRLPSLVLAAVKAAAGDFPIGVRFDADECIKGGYSLPDAQEIAVRLAGLGAAYVSLSAGGKFEDAIHKPGLPLYPYTGYSGDRCMPGRQYPDAANIWLADGVRRALRARALATPVIGAGKIGKPELAEALLQEEKCDLIGMARALLADPYWPVKVRDGCEAEIVRCIYCNVCKTLDENFKTVRCYLWPRELLHAPRPGEVERAELVWPGDEPLRAVNERGLVRLVWDAAHGGAAGYDLFRAEDGTTFERLVATHGTATSDEMALGGRSYSYYVQAFDAAGRRGLPSNLVAVGVPAWRDPASA